MSASRWSSLLLAVLALSTAAHAQAQKYLAPNDRVAEEQKSSRSGASAVAEVAAHSDAGFCCDAHAMSTGVTETKKGRLYGPSMWCHGVYHVE